MKPELSVMPEREFQDRTPRKAMTKSRRERVLARFNGKCASPGCSVVDSLQIDHTLALELGGLDEDFNLRPLCTYHHKLKTKLDVATIAKARRNRRREAGEKRSTKAIPPKVNAWSPKGVRKLPKGQKLQSRRFAQSPNPTRRSADPNG